MSQFLSQFFSFTRVVVGQMTQNSRRFPSVLPNTTNGSQFSQALTNPWSFDVVRENHKTFRPRESIRVKRHGFYAKVRTRGGRQQIMRRILKGRFVLTH